MQQALERLHGADVGIQPQLLAHGQQALFGAHLGRRVVVILGIAHGREQHGVGLLTYMIGILREGVAHLVDGVRPAESVLISHFVAKLLAHGSHHVHAYGGNLRPDTVTGQYGNFQFHCSLSFSCFITSSRYF